MKWGREFCKKEGIRHFVCESEELNIEGFAENPKDRCYLCKKELFKKIQVIAEENQMENIVEGSNLDDNGDYRPGLLAVAELGIKSPLRECNLTKADIRALSKYLELPTWEKQSFACLSSRLQDLLSLCKKSSKEILFIFSASTNIFLYGFQHHLFGIYMLFLISAAEALDTF